ncbi:MAG: ABC transporter ATP-binding protein/permease [Firmicutes bacterium]|nr:ABC transporter ATP-binding protein/permease [Bacillota bacterium]
MIQIKGVQKTYDRGLTKETRALKGIDLTLGDVGLVGILGKSGCGKTTLLHCLAGLDAVDGGQIIVGDKDIVRFSKKELDEYRNKEIAVVFQEFYCMDDLTVAQNVNLALWIQGKKVNHSVIDNVLQSVGIAELANRKLTELSGGQKQRVAIARALVKDAKVILCDEPTGNLDEENAKQIFGILQNIAKDRLVIVVSHDKENTQAYCDRVVSIVSGLVESDVSRETAQEISKSSAVAVASGAQPTGKMPAGLRLKTGMGWMVAKKVRLVMSILLPAVILGVFLTAFVVSTFVPLKKDLEQFYQYGARAVGMNRTYQGKNDGHPNNDDRMKDEEIQQIKQTHTSALAYHNSLLGAPVKLVLGAHKDEMYSDYTNWSAGDGSFRLMELENDRMAKDFGIEVIKGYGRLPAENPDYDEVAITDFVYYAYYEGAQYQDAEGETHKITSPNDLFDNEIMYYYKVYNSGGETDTGLKPIKVVGMVNTGFVLDQFLDQSTYQADRIRRYADRFGGQPVSLADTIANTVLLGKGNGWISEILPVIDDSFANASRLMVALKGDYDQDKVLFEQHEYFGVKYEYRPYTPSFEGMNYIYQLSVRAGQAALWIAGGASIFSMLLIMNFMLSIVDSNRKKVGIMCALGIRRRDLDGIFMFGCGFVGVLVTAAAIGVGAAFLPLVNSFFMIDNSFVLTGLSIAVIAVLTLGSTALMTLAPLKKLTKKRTIDIIKKAV